VGLSENQDKPSKFAEQGRKHGFTEKMTWPAMHGFNDGGIFYFIPAARIARSSQSQLNSSCQGGLFAPSGKA
jgi:hypothetical protein